MTSQYRCETCTRKDPRGYGWCRYANAHVNPPNSLSAIAEFTSRCGCTSHSSLEQSVDVLDEVRKIVVELYDDGFKDPLVTFDAAVSKYLFGDLKIRNIKQKVKK